MGPSEKDTTGTHWTGPLWPPCLPSVGLDPHGGCIHQGSAPPLSVKGSPSLAETLGPVKPKLPTQGGALTAADGPRAEHGSCRDGGHRSQQAGPPARRLDAGWSGWGWGRRACPSLGETGAAR